MSWGAVKSVARHEFRVRLRAGRWRVVLAVWFAVLLGFTALLRLGLAASNSERLGSPMFGALMLLLLGLGLLIVPALTGQSINGDRERGVLASLQVTLLTPTDIALGKLLAGWVTSTVFVAASLPMVLWSMFEGGVGLTQAVVTVFVVIVLLGVLCAVAQCLSAVFVRGTTSAVVSYLVVFAATAGTVIVFALAATSSSTTVKRDYQNPVCSPETTFDGVHCVNLSTQAKSDPVWVNDSYTSTEPRYDRVWWILAPNPFVILADAAPEPPQQRYDATGRAISNDLDILGGIAGQVESLRHSPQNYVSIETPEKSVVPIWAVGLAFDLALAALAVWVTIRRLCTPAATLARGVRIA